MSRTEAIAGEFCWVDLAAADTVRAGEFYRRLFGWTACEETANGGVFTRLRLAGRDVGSMYQLGRAQQDNGVPSHWTPYVRVDDAAVAARRAEQLGGRVIVRPFAVADVASIALILDAAGAAVGLWQPLRKQQEMQHGKKNRSAQE